MIYKGNAKIEKIYKGSNRIWRVYKGSNLVFGYEPNTVLFESSTPGTYTINVDDNCIVNIVIVGAGAGGAYSFSGMAGSQRAYGGCGALIQGQLELKAGTYTAVVGAASGNASTSDGGITAQDGGNSSFNSNIAGGGKGGYAYAFYEGRTRNGEGGTPTVVSSGLTGTSGRKGTTDNTYGSYGGGGYPGTSPKSGYVKIIVSA